MTPIPHITMDRIIRNSILAEDGSGCWIWIGYYKASRCGWRPQMTIRHPETGKPVGRLAYRMAVVASGRRLGQNQVVRHQCDNQHCVNPAHLKVGTQSQNVKEWHARRVR